MLAGKDRFEAKGLAEGCVAVLLGQFRGWFGGVSSALHMGGCQNYGPFLGTLNIRCRTIIGTQKGTIILTTTHMLVYWVAQEPE